MPWKGHLVSGAMAPVTGWNSNAGSAPNGKGALDTNILIDFLGGAPARDEIALYDHAAISIVTWMEVMVGAPERATDATRVFLDRFELVGLDRDIADLAVQLRRSHGVKLPDAIIWASARHQGRLLVTRNTKDFPPGDPGVRAPYVIGPRSRRARPAARALLSRANT